MTERKTFADVIIRGIQNNQQQYGYQQQQQGFNPNFPQQQQQNNNDDQYGDRAYDQRSTREINQENKNLRELIARIEKQNANQPPKMTQQMEQGSNIRRRIQHNNEKIQEFNDIVIEQRQVISTYKRQIEEFERNLLGIMKLDKDIHSKLVNPHTSSTLQKNVKNVLIALNSKAPYDKVIKMIENIRV